MEERGVRGVKEKEKNKELMIADRVAWCEGLDLILARHLRDKSL